MHRIVILILCLGVIIPVTGFASEQADFQSAKDAFDAGERLKAQGLFEKFVADYPESNYIPNSIYYLGRLESNPQRALELYTMVWEEYPKSDVADDALYEVAQYYYATGEYKTAIDKYRQLLSDYKRSELACKAQYWLGNALFAIKEFEPAIEEYRNVKVKYPGCEKIPEAELGIAQTHYKMGNYRDASVQFQTILSEQKDSGVLSAALYGLGECSEKNANIEMAIYAYEKLIEDFPSSQETAHAKVRLAQLKKQYDVETPKPEPKPEPEEVPEEEEVTEEQPKEAAKNYTIQVGAFREEENARQLVQKLNGLGYDAKMIKKTDAETAVQYKVWVGEYETRADAEEVAINLKEDSPNISTFVLRIEE
jgi:TolA-binding protein